MDETSSTPGLVVAFMEDISLECMEGITTEKKPVEFYSQYTYNKSPGNYGILSKVRKTILRYMIF